MKAWIQVTNSCAWNLHNWNQLSKTRMTTRQCEYSAVGERLPVVHIGVRRLGYMESRRGCLIRCC